MIDAIEARGSARIERTLIFRACARGEALERIPQYRIARAPPVHRVIAFEHRAAWPECLDTGLEIGPPHIAPPLRSIARSRAIQGHAAIAHRQSAQLDGDTIGRASGRERG